MDGLSGVASVVAVVQIAGSIAKLCGGYIATVKDAPKDIERLQHKAVALRDVLQRMNEMMDGHRNTRQFNPPKDIREAIAQCFKDLEQLHEKLQPKKGQQTTNQLVIRALRWPLSKSSIIEATAKIEDYLRIFNAAVLLDHYVLSQEIQGIVDRSEKDQLLSSIFRVSDAAYDSYENQRHRSCLRNTRVDLLGEILDWATSHSSQYIFWLGGAAGTGKSTIALTISQELHEVGSCLASFFFKRGSGDLARSRHVIGTIVFQLATKCPPLRDLVCEALRENPDLGSSASISQQYEKLLLRPLQKARLKAPQLSTFFVVLDALDECDDVADVRVLLKLLGSAQDMADLGLRMLITSRPDIQIRREFNMMTHVNYRELSLHKIARNLVDRDIKSFVAHELARVRVERQLPVSWPGDEKIELITAHADGLFIYAATVCQYIDGPWQIPPSLRLDHVCRATGLKHQSTEKLDSMYGLILMNSMQEDFSPEEEVQVTKSLREIVGSIVTLFENLSPKELARLLLPYNEPPEWSLIQQTLDPLHAVLDIPHDKDQPVRTLHLSFRDFLVDRDRCVDKRFHIDQDQVHCDLLRRCIDLMENTLRRNICDLSGPGTFVKQIPRSTLNKCLPLGLQYACRYWIKHAELRETALLDGHGLIHGFLRHHFLHWLEIMSLTSNYPDAIVSVSRLNDLAKEKSAPALYSLTNDILKYMRTFSHIIVKAPLQLYSSCMLFSPTNCVFRKTFYSQVSSPVEVLTQISPDWNPCIQTLEGHTNSITSLIFCHDGSKAVSGSADCTLRVWDMPTGHCIHVLEGHRRKINGLAISQDGSRVASTSEGNGIRVWDISTGKCLFVTKTSLHQSDSHPRSSQVTLSQNGLLLAYISIESKVVVWNVQTDMLVNTPECPVGQNTFIKISFLDDFRLATLSANGYELWDILTGQCLQTHAVELGSLSDRYVKLSPDGSRLAYFDYNEDVDTHLTIYDMKTAQFLKIYISEPVIGKPVIVTNIQGFSGDGSEIIYECMTGLAVANPITGQCRMLHRRFGGSSSTAFSRDGQRVLCGSTQGSISVIDMRGVQYQDIGHYLDAVVSLIFSRDGLIVISGSCEGLVKTWDAQTGRCLTTFEGHTDVVTCVAISSDGSKIASGTPTELRIWNVQTGQCDYWLESSDKILGVAFSPDGMAVASGLLDGAVQILTFSTGQTRLLGTDWVKIRSLAFSPDGSAIIAAGQSEAQVWDLRTSTKLCQILVGPQEIVDVLLSYHGTMAVLKSESRTPRCCWVDVWDVATKIRLLRVDCLLDIWAELEFNEDQSAILIDEASFLIPSREVVTSFEHGLPDLRLPRSACSLGIDDDAEWVTQRTGRVLWLGEELLPFLNSYSFSFAKRGNSIAIGADNGQVKIVRLKPS